MLGLVLALADGRPACAASNAQLPARTVFEMAAALDRLAPEERDAIRLQHRLRALTPGEGLQLWYVEQGRRVDVPLLADGRFERPAALTRADVAVTMHANRPLDDLDLNIDLLVQLPDGREFRYADLARAAAQMNGFARRQAGLAGVFAPKVHSLQFRCEQRPDCALTVHLPAGARTYLPDAKDRIVLRLSAALKDANPRITTAQPFAEIVGDLD